MSHANLVLVTPEIASRWLEQNPHNRKKSAKHVAYLVREIKEGRYRQNGETIKRSATGNLLDGQHRLEAIKTSGVSLELFVVEGLDDSVFSTIDTGRMARTTAQVMALAGVTNASSTAAVCRAMMDTMACMAGNTTTRKMSPDELRQFLEDKREILEPLIHEFVRANGPARTTTASVVGAMGAVVINRPGSLGAVLELLQAVHRGSNLVEGSPALALHRRLMEGLGSRKARLDQRTLQALTVKATVAHIDGKAMATLRVNAKEEFPRA